jgi:excisionase family DNA binding protein
MSGQLLTARELADRLGLSPETVLRKWRAGELPGYRLASNCLRFDEAEVERWLESMQAAGAVDRAEGSRVVRRLPPSSPIWGPSPPHVVCPLSSAAAEQTHQADHSEDDDDDDDHEHPADEDPPPIRVPPGFGGMETRGAQLYGVETGFAVRLQPPDRSRNVWACRRLAASLERCTVARPRAVRLAARVSGACAEKETS